MMHVDTVSDLRGFLALEPQWNQVLSESADRHAFLAFDYLKTEWEHLGWDRPLPSRFDTFALVVRDGARVTGLLPLVRYRTRLGGLPVTTLRVLGWLSMRRGMVLAADPGPTLTAALEHLVRHESWAMIEMFPVPVDSVVHKWMPQACGTLGLGLHAVDSHESPFIRVEGDWASYLATRSKNFHQVLKNKTNRLTREGGFRCVAYESPDEVEGILPTIFEIDDRSWKGRAGTAIGSSPGARRFYTALSQALARRGEVSIWVLWRGDRAVAFEYHVLYDGVVFSLKWSYDQEHHPFSPGLVLKRASTEYFWTRGAREIDLLGNADGFKLKWTSEVRRHVNLYAFNRGPYAWLVDHVEFGVKPFLKRQPLIARAVDRIRGRGATSPATDE